MTGGRQGMLGNATGGGEGSGQAIGVARGTVVGGREAPMNDNTGDN